MQAADDVELGDRLGVAGRSGVKDLFQRHGVGARRALLAAEGAQAAGRDTDVGVVDVPVDVEVSRVAVQALANMIRQPPDRQDVAGTVERQRIVGREPLLCHDLVVNGSQAGVVGLKRMKLLGAGRIRHNSSMITQRG
jgi:hypothetical protein